MRNRLLTFVFAAATLGALSAPAALARWATPDDAEWDTESMTMEVQVRKDGTSTAETDSVLKILREGARSKSTFHLTYNSRASRFKVLAAETLNGDRKFPVESDYIEDKPQASPEYGFDQFNQVSVAFPKVEIGSLLHFRNRREVTEVPFPGHYSAEFEFGLNWMVKTETIHIRSELPLYLDVNDPQGKLEVTQKKSSDDDYEVTIRLKSEIYVHPIDEPWVSINPKDRTYVVVSTTKAFPQLGELLAAKYDEVLNSPLPKSYEEILEHARAKKTMVDKLNTITSELADQIRYLGDWRPIRGGHIPRALETVASTRFGDCKDFSAATVAILRRMGVKANVAWVERAVQPDPLPKIANDGAFNHAIVWLSAEGREWWIDPTNFASFAQGLFPDIIDRQALVVDPGASRLATIPAGNPSESARTSLGRVKLEPTGDAEIETDLRYRGRAAQAFTGATMRQSKEHVDHFLITSLVDENRLKWRAIDDYDLTSRVTRDFSIHLRWGEMMYSMRTTMGPAFYLGSAEVDPVMRLDTKKRVSDLFLGQPELSTSIDVYENVRALGRRPPTCELDSPWLRVSRKVEQTAHGLRIADSREIRKSLITNAELKSAPFQKFQAELLRCFDRVAVVYERGRAGPPRAISSAVSPAERGAHERW